MAREESKLPTCDVLHVGGGRKRTSPESSREARGWLGRLKALRVCIQVGTEVVLCVYFFYSFDRERERAHNQVERQVEGEADSLLSKEPSAGIPGPPGS